MNAFSLSIQVVVIVCFIALRTSKIVNKYVLRVDYCNQALLSNLNIEYYLVYFQAALHFP